MVHENLKLLGAPPTHTHTHKEKNKWLSPFHSQLIFNFCRLMYDPYNSVVYDYLGGMEDIRQAKVCMHFSQVII